MYNIIKIYGGVFLKDKLTGGKLYCLISILIIFVTYIVQKVLNIYLEHTNSVVITEAILFSLLTLFVYLLLLKSKEPFYGILTAIFGIRMMPPDIPYLNMLSPEAGIVYYLVQKFAFVIFAFAIVRLYEEQKKPRMIKPIPILCTILIVPFFNEISERIVSFIVPLSNGNMLYSYFAQFAIYTIAMIALLFVATRCSKLSSKLIADFEIIALLLNAGRKLCAVMIMLSNGDHVSRSYYCWILIYLFFGAAFYALRKRRKTSAV